MLLIKVSFLILSFSSLCFAASSDPNHPDLEILQGQILHEAKPLNDLIEEYGEESSWDELEQNEKIESHFISEFLNRFFGSQSSETVKIIWATHEYVRNTRMVQRAKLIMQWKGNIYMYIGGVGILLQENYQSWYHVTEDFQGNGITPTSPPETVEEIFKVVLDERTDRPILLEDQPSRTFTINITCSSTGNIWVDPSGYPLLHYFLSHRLR